MRRALYFRGAESQFFSVKRILVIDDERDFGFLMKSFFSPKNYDVHIAYTLADGMKLLEEQNPDFIFLDIGLPGLNGYDLARNLRQLPSTQRSILVAITGWGQAGDKRRAREAGFDHHVVKPVEPTEIHAILTRFHVARRV